MGIKCAIYIDDSNVGHSKFEAAQHIYICICEEIVKKDLDSAGFVLNLAKSYLHPSQHGRWLGFEIDTT